jgi:hypothetical protein
MEFICGIYIGAADESQWKSLRGKNATSRRQFAFGAGKVLS